MSERLHDSEAAATSEWDVFVQKNPDLNLEEIKSKDPAALSLIVEFYQIRKDIRDMVSNRATKVLSNFGEKLNSYIGDDYKKEAELKDIFESIVSKFK